MIIDVDDATPSTTNKRVTFSILQNAAQTPWATNIDADEKILDNLSSLIQNSTVITIPLEEYGLQVLNDNYVLQLGTITDEFRIRFTDEVTGFIPYTFSLTTFTAPNITVNSALNIVDTTSNPTQDGEFTNNAGDVIIQSGGNDINISNVSDPPFDDDTALVQNSIDNTKTFQVDVSGSATGIATVLGTTSTTLTRNILFPDATGVLVLEDNTQNLENKSIDADNNTLTNLELGAEVTGASTDLTDTANIARLNALNIFTQDQSIASNTANGNLTIQTAAASSIGSSLTLIGSRGTIVTPTTTLGNDLFGNLEYQGFTGTAFKTGAAIQVRASGSWNDAPVVAGTRLSFLVATTDTPSSLLSVFVAEGSSTFMNVSFPQGMASDVLRPITGTGSTVGFIRIPNTESIGWRNFAGDGNLLLSVNSDDFLTFGSSFVAQGDILTSVIASGALDAPSVFKSTLDMVSSRGTIASPTEIISGDNMSEIRYKAFESGTSTFPRVADIFTQATENHTSITNLGTKMVIRTGRTGGALLTSLTIEGDGLLTPAVGIQSSTANPATAEIYRLARVDSLAWRNEANSANLLLSVNSSNELTFDGVVIAPPFDDTTILIQDATNNDRTFQLDVGSSATSNTTLRVNSSADRVMNLPDTSGAIPLLETNNVFTNTMTNLRDGTGGAFTLINFDDQDFDDMQLEFKRGKGTQSLSTPVDVDTFLGSIIFNGLGTNFFVAGASIIAIATETFTNSTAATKLLFATTPTTTSTPVTRLVIEPTGIFDFQSNSIINVTLTSPVITGGQLDTTVGFFGTTPIAQESVASDTLANLYTALRAYGIIA